MSIIFTILNLIFVLLAIAGFVLTLCLPIGIILLIVYLSKKKEKRSKKMFKWIIILFSGVPILVTVFVLYAIFGFITTLVGANPFVNLNGGLMNLSN